MSGLRVVDLYSVVFLDSGRILVTRNRDRRMGWTDNSFSTGGTARLSGPGRAREPGDEKQKHKNLKTQKKEKTRVWGVRYK